MSQQNNPWIQKFKPQDQATARLFCFPFAGGGTQSFAKWADQLPDEIEVCAVQLPGRETRMREPAHADVHLLLDQLLPAVGPLLDRPFFLFGHSMGALIAFEFARRVTQQYGVSPERLFVSARVAPHRKAPREPINGLDQEAFVNALRGLNGTPAEVLGDAQLMALISPMLRADFALNENYVYTPQPRLGCDLVAFGGLCDPEAGRDGLDAWREATDGAFALRMVPGDHFFLQSAQSLFLRMLSIELYDVLGRLPAKGQATLTEAVC